MKNILKFEKTRKAIVILTNEQNHGTITYLDANKEKSPVFEGEYFTSKFLR